MLFSHSTIVVMHPNIPTSSSICSRSLATIDLDMFSIEHALSEQCFHLSTSSMCLPRERLWNKIFIIYLLQMTLEH